jgi:Spy/CpxP family protein refolding chaperone
MTMTTMTSTATHTKKRHLWFLLLGIPVVLGAALCGLRAHAQDGGMGMGPMFGGGSPEQHKAFMEKRVDRMLDNVKATDSQRTAIKAIFERTFTDLQPIHQSHQRLHEDMVKALTANTVDRTAIEKLRTQATALLEQGSQVLSKSLADAAEVLTPDQRRTLAKFIEEHHGRHHHF